jgi:hypothetical protein
MMRQRQVDCIDAITEILDQAKSIKLAGQRYNVVAMARREFAKNGTCSSKFIDPIEKIIRERIETWTLDQKRELWLSTESGEWAEEPIEDYHEASIDMELEAELLDLILKELSGA